MKRLLFCWLSTCALHLTVSAHVLDQYLQVAQIALVPDGVRIELRLIPGAQVADCVFALIDANRDGQLTQAEQQAYAQRVLQDLALTIKQQAAPRTLPLVLEDAQFPERRAMNEGLGAIRLTLSAQMTQVGTGQQQVNFRNDHLPEIGVYMVNALVPESDTITIASQERDAMQRGVQLNFQTVNANASSRLRWIGFTLFGLGLGLAKAMATLAPFLRPK